MQKRQPRSLLASLFGRPAKDDPATKKKVVAAAQRPFQSVAIHRGSVCCAGARKLDGQRFLAKDAPPVPLSDCPMRATCKCRYEKYGDRRDTARRSGEFGLKQTLFSGEDKRRSRGRRVKD